MRAALRLTPQGTSFPLIATSGFRQEWSGAVNWPRCQASEASGTRSPASSVACRTIHPEWEGEALLPRVLHAPESWSHAGAKRRDKAAAANPCAMISYELPPSTLTCTVDPSKDTRKTKKEFLFSGSPPHAEVVDVTRLERNGNVPENPRASIPDTLVVPFAFPLAEHWQTPDDIIEIQNWPKICELPPRQAQRDRGFVQRDPSEMCKCWARPPWCRPPAPGPHAVHIATAASASNNAGSAFTSSQS